MGGGMKSFVENVLPFAAMVIVETGEVGMVTLAKSALNDGLSSLVYVVYYNALGTILLLPNFIIHSYRNNRPPLTLSVLSKLFVLGLLGICFLQIFGYAGVNYSSPTLAAALGNLIPAFTFLLAIIFRIEKFDIRKSTSQAKALGTFVAISGACVMTFYQGPALVKLFIDHVSHKNLLLATESNWVLGGLLIGIACISSSLWNVFQTATVKEYPDEITVVFLFCCFGTLQCAIFTLIYERHVDVWILQTRTEWISIVFSALFGTAIRSSVITWCLRKRGPVFVSMFKPISMVIAVIMGIIFLGDVLHLGSVIGAVIIAPGVYTVLWGQAKERNLAINNVSRLESSTENTPLLLQQ
ncbi:WAT1-related protein At3g28050-like [Rutidosis leptorrhynchoides]|uniref:WAT1-related protein At3g28050-like n=1 Tax=Rutidosis leptorrhynchoides TaxID=125765 RepID=UPI003A98E393